MLNKKFSFENLDTHSKKFLGDIFPLRDGYIKYNGYIVPVNFQKFIDRIENLDIRDDDIWVCGYLKTGTTWTQEMIWCIINSFDHDDSRKYIYERSPLLDFAFLYDDANSQAEQLNDTTYDFLINSIEYVEKMASPRIIKTHLPYELLPKKLRNFSTKAKIIKITRNPRDTFVSYYYFMKLLRGPNNTKSLGSFLEMVFRGNIPFGPFPNHIKGYLEHVNNRNILFLSYEEMKKDLKSTISKTCNFLKKEIDKEYVEKLLKHLSFSSMKENPAVNHEAFLQFRGKIDSVENDHYFMRRGIVGDWKEKLDTELCQKFSRWENENFNEIKFVYLI